MGKAIAPEGTEHPGLLHPAQFRLNRCHESGFSCRLGSPFHFRWIWKPGMRRNAAAAFSIAGLARQIIDHIFVQISQCFPCT